jgi:hypothetical protein
MRLNETSQNPPPIFLEFLLTALTASGTILILGWLIRYSGYGIDFTDESFYLVWIANPYIYSGSITQFGFVYHPLYNLLGGDVAALRQANILLTFGMAWCLTYYFFVSLAPSLKGNRFTLFTVSAGFATCTFILFDSWLLTPSYNSLALQSLLICTLGLVLADKTPNRASITGWILIGVGGWLAFMAKPSTAIALAVGVLSYLLLARKFSIRMVALTVVCTLALLVVSALLIDGSILGFIKRIQLGLEFSGLLGGRHTLDHILRIDDFYFNERGKPALLVISGMLFIALWSLLAKNKKWSLICLLISISFFIITALLTFGQTQQVAGLGKFQGMLIFAVSYGSAITALVFGRIKSLKVVSAPHWAIAALFLLMPHIYAFGTNMNYWESGSSAGFFWPLAGLTLLGPLIRARGSWLIALPLTLAAQAITATLLQKGLEQPYRQPEPLRLNKSIVEIGPQKSQLLLSEDYANYILNAIASAQKAGFEPNDSVIDLSGQSSGVLYVLGAESIGAAWVIGGYPGSLKYAQSAFEQVACEKISTAWILFEQNGPRSIPTDLMLNLGFDFPNSYEIVGSWQTAKGAGGYLESRTQQFYKPVESDNTLAACRKLRKEAEKH